MGVMETLLGLLYYLALILGSAVILVILVSMVITGIVALLLAYSFKTGNVLFPNLMISGLMFFDSPVKTIFRAFGVGESRIDRIGIRMKNRAICPSFRKTPFSKRAIFVPQCLRSVRCPAALSPEGIMCKDCGACGIASARKEATKLGYKFFIVPGSSFIIRMIRQYQPEAIIGVGCLCEVREGLDMMHRSKIPAMGVIMDRAGCVSTTLDWQKLYEIMNLSDSPVDQREQQPETTGFKDALAEVSIPSR
ncbi:DUF116 domain-containing protein [Methanocella arvoryzae]|uniref:DUF116 domain-containing protein n=1 Tax=Methanocella arvoryzae (strain DSM 22066 / NBRC 105507 / MRE50) TaxID=351160 RepID=Q0W0I5_METAR|nr:DUF116 domain-containing protein [Methanocella arvoryzae]CAJ38108.1 conserved hypothetical protein [Methanocella arvoryzae MRE50]